MTLAVDAFEQLFESATPKESMRRSPHAVKRPRGKVRRVKVPRPGKAKRSTHATSPALIARIQKLAAKGKTLSEIAEKTGVSFPTAKKYSADVKVTAQPAATHGEKPAAPGAAKKGEWV